MLVNKFFRLVLSLVLLQSLTAQSATAAQTRPKKLASAPPATATLPLAEILRLHRDSDRAKQKQTKSPPVAFTLEKVEYQGRLLDGAIDIEVHFQLSVLAAQWVSIELLQLDSNTQLTTLPQVNDGYFTAQDGRLLFLSQKQGRYRFSLQLLKKANISHQNQHIQIAKQAAIARMNLTFDAGLFELIDSDVIRQGDKLQLYAKDKMFTIRWKRLNSGKVMLKQATKRQPTDSVIKMAQASVVSTLGGQRIIRIVYDLQFAGQKNIDFNFPVDQKLQRVFLNNIPVSFTIEGQTLQLTVTPTRAGDESAKLELVLKQQQGGYLLSGELSYPFPSTSWGVNDLYVSLHLPDVFKYKWTGGSLAPASHLPAANFSHRIPTPGKQIILHQQLITGKADVRLLYTVDLAGQYFTGQ